MEYDFGGWATRNNIECSDGRTILKDAFKQNNGQKVPLVWNHRHDDPNEVLGHALLENRDEGVYAYCKFNDTESGKTAKELVVNGDVDKLSIYANKLKTQSNKVMHGCIREVSLVLAGANPGAFIDSVIAHSDETDEDEEEGVIFTDEHISLIEHSEKEDNTMDEKETNAEETVEDIFNTLTDKQQAAVYAIVGQALEESNKNNEGDEDMKHNVFDEKDNNEVLQHSEIIASAMADAKQHGSLKDSFLAHAAINNIDGLDKLFPEATEIYKEPYVIEDDNAWVSQIMNKTTHSPFSRVKATFGKLKEPEARAKGYIKGNLKTDMQMAFLNRVTTPTTIYIKNDIDRDDLVDITDFDIVKWQKREMRKQLDKEIARAVLLGDGRNISDDDKINEQNVRPVLTDNEMFTIQYTVTEGVDYKITDGSYSDNDAKLKGIVRAAVKSRKNYKGTGKPTFYTSEAVLDDLLLLENQNGERLYKSEEDLCKAMRVNEIVTIPEMESYTDIYGIIVNMADYKIGADKGGNVSMFDDFDIDYNQMKYLMETRISGALVVPYSAIVIRKTAIAG